MMNRFTHQGILSRQLKEIFPGEDIQEDVKKHINVKFDSGKYMQFDVWIPKYDLCFEFQDDYHYVTTWYSELTHERIKQKDNTKAEVVRNSTAITLIHVPCWWDGSSKRLIGTIRFQRPDMFPSSLLLKGHKSAAIPLNPPNGLFPSSSLPEVGELMLASFPSPAQFAASMEDTSWWMGEKYDGIRCLWSPRDKIAYARHGVELTVLPKMIEHLPFVCLDGELWFGRQQYGLTFTLHTNFSQSHWETLRLASFDVPSRHLHDTPFEERYQLLLQSVHPELHPWTIVAPRLSVECVDQVRWVSQQIILDGGEGLILRAKCSPYQPGRSRALVKLKSSHSDGEGIVVRHGPKKSVVLKLPNGKLLLVEGSHVLIPLPKIGAIVTFSFDYQARSNLPRNARIVRVRNDVAWDDVIRNSLREKVLYEGPSAFTKESHGLWSKKKMRAYMENFATSRGLDFLAPKTWYDSYTSFYKYKEGRNLIKRTKGGYANLCMSIFPDVPFDGSLFTKSSFYSSVANRRLFFEKLARQHGFDPLVPRNWYYFSTTNVKTAKGGPGVIRHHNETVSQALVDLFPDIGLDPSKFCVATIWADEAKRKAFLRKYARLNHFDYRAHEDWASHLARRLPKAIRRILKFHNNSMLQALRDLFDKDKGNDDDDTNPTTRDG